jgi:hypothetical protein
MPVHRAAVERLLAEPEDRRQSALAKAAAIEAYTSPGCRRPDTAKLGFRINANGGRSKPDEPRLAILNVRRWMTERLSPELQRLDVATTVLGGSELRRLQLQRAEQLRRVMHVVGDRTRVAPISAGVFPDLLLNTNWPADRLNVRAEWWPQRWVCQLGSRSGLRRCGRARVLDQSPRRYGKEASKPRGCSNSRYRAVVERRPLGSAFPRHGRVIRRTLEAIEEVGFMNTPHYVVAASRLGLGDQVGAAEIPLRWPEAVGLGLLDDESRSSLSDLFGT